MRSPVHANFGLAESVETSIKCQSISLVFPRGKGLFSYTDLQNGEGEEIHRGSFGSLNIRRGSMKLKE